MEIPGKRIETEDTIYTPPFSRGGDGMILRAQLLSKGGATGSVDIDVYTKNEEDTTWSSSIGTLSVALTGTVGDITELHIPASSGASGIEEQLRLRFTATTNWGMVRVFPPLFYDTAST